MLGYRNSRLKIISAIQYVRITYFRTTSQCVISKILVMSSIWEIGATRDFHISNGIIVSFKIEDYLSSEANDLKFYNL